VTTGRPQISASVLTADFAVLGEEVRRAVAAQVDSIHLDVMDGHFVENITFGPAVAAAIHPHVGDLPVHSHLMISQPLRHVRAFADAASDLIVFHVEADDDPDEVIQAVRATGRMVGLALNPETDAAAVRPYLARIDLLLVMTVHPGRGGQTFLVEVLPKMRALRDEIDDSGLALPIGVDGGVNLETIASAHAAGGEVLVVGSALYRHAGDLGSPVTALREAARAPGHRR
jgi:ribulose-phosphate 3-epimerase